MLFKSSADFFQNEFFQKNSLWHIIRVSSSLDPNCLQKLTADNNVVARKERV